MPSQEQKRLDRNPGNSQKRMETSSRQDQSNERPYRSIGQWLAGDVQLGVGMYIMYRSRQWEVDKVVKHDQVASSH